MQQRQLQRSLLHIALVLEKRFCVSYTVQLLQDFHELMPKASDHVIIAQIQPLSFLNSRKNIFSSHEKYESTFAWGFENTSITSEEKNCVLLTCKQQFSSCKQLYLLQKQAAKAKKNGSTKSNKYLFRTSCLEQRSHHTNKHGSAFLTKAGRSLSVLLLLPHIAKVPSS